MDSTTLAILSSFSLFSAVNTFNSGSLAAMSFTAVGISSYISASIVIQLLSTGIKSIEDISKAPGGQKIIKRATIILGVLLSFITSIGFTMMLKSQYEDVLTNDSWYAILIIALCHCVGTAFSIWIGETISEKGFGNGVSLLIALNIATSLPQYIDQIINGGTDLACIVGAIMFVVLLLVIVLETSEARIPVSYSKSIVYGQYSTVPKDTYLPVKVNIAGVMPIIFASTLSQIASIVVEITGIEVPEIIEPLLDYGSIPYMVLSVIIVFIFTYFYSALLIKPDEIAKQLQHLEGVIVGVRPGLETEKYVAKLMRKLNLIGAIYMSIIVLLPMVLFKVVGYYGLQPNSIIILAGVGLEMVQKIQIEYLAHTCTHCKDSVFLTTYC